MNPETALDNIVFARAFTHEHQSQLITGKENENIVEQRFSRPCTHSILFVLFSFVEIAAKMVEDHFRVLIIDSITALFRYILLKE